MRTRNRLAASLVLVAVLSALATYAQSGQSPQTPSPGSGQAVALPNRANSLKFAVLGDFGTGSRQQRELAAQMAKLRAAFPYELVITVGDNIYGGERPQDMRRKFEEPYKPLLDAGVKFYASLGNHDERAQSRYAPFNMDGKTYYTFKAPKQDVRFFALESDYLDPKQVAWLEKEMGSAGEKWKIPYFHHPLYSSGDRHGSRLDLRTVLEPIFLANDVTVVFTGHDHFYERVKPQKGMVHFVVGSGGQLRRGNIDRKTGLTAMGFDTDQAFLAAEIDGDQLFFNAISRAGNVIDSGVIERRTPARP
ncbi:MAG TPA: metallophosphoesterase [Vicinamibacterales bacterium]|jgi:hypothetical protein